MENIPIMITIATGAPNMDKNTIATIGIVRGFRAVTSKPPANTTATLTVMKNGAPTSITCSFTNFNACVDNTHQEFFAAGDVVSVRIVRTGTGTGIWSANVAVTLATPSTVVQTSTPDEMRGRVSALNGLFIGTSNELGAFESGAVADLIGPVGSVVIGGIGTIVVVAITAWLSPDLRKYGRLGGP